MAEDIVITGIGVVSPIGVNEAEFWDSLASGRSGAAAVDCLDTSELTRKIGCQVKGEAWKAGLLFEPCVGRAAQLAVSAARQAAGSARLGGGDIAAIEPSRVSVVIGTTMGETEFIEDRLVVKREEWLSAEHAKEILCGQPGFISRRVAGWLMSREGIPAESTGEKGFSHERADASDDSPPRPTLTPAPLPARERGLQQELSPERSTASPPLMRESLLAPQLTRGRGVEAVDLYGACAAGNLALGAARRRLLNGECDVAIAGGADGFSRLAFLGFMRLRVMAAEVCRPFDQARDGLFVGEGAAVFVLERESTAKARGAKIRARIIGAADAGENYHPTRPHPEGDGLSRAIGGALADAGIAAGEVDYICAHGTGTPQNDAIEVGVMNKLFPAGTPFSSIKALTGHTMGAAAAVEAAACVLSLERQTLLPTWHLDKVLEPCSLEAVKGGPRAGRLRCVINNSAGFGGYNSSVVIAAA